MINSGYVRAMARYNSWQNKQLMPILEALPQKELKAERGAFFGSILATANHLLWGDMMWMSRFDPSSDAPRGGIAESVDLHPTVSTWAADRFRMDSKICFWAEGLRELDLQNTLTWFSGAAGRQVSAKLQLCIMHFFNHQTHHRGQIHAMLTAAGHPAPISDLFLMPEES